ncbi:MAG TPA: FtsX-like permease family protein [Paludibaculum sp.]|jgi:putative ABC transport system permease protein
MRFLTLIVKNCLRNRRRSFLTIFSLSISLCLLGVMAALYYALFFGAPPKAQARRAVTRHKVSIVFQMPIYYREQIRKVRGVEEVAIWQWYGGAYKDSRDQRNFFPRLAVEADRLFKIYLDYQIPDEQKQAFIRDPAGCIIGKQLADRFNFKVGDKILIKGDIFPFDLDLTVRGIYTSEESNEDTLWFNFKYLENALRNSSRLAAGTFTILAADAADIPRISKEVDELFANAPAPTRTESEYSFGLSFLSFLGNIKVILMSICGAVTFTILLISANTMAMSVRERVREVGVLKTLGFQNSTIMGMILAESAVIALLGGVIGLSVAQILCIGIRQGPAIVDQTKTLTIQPPVLLALLALSVFIGICSAIVPAWNASRTNIIDALRFTD